MKEKKKNKLHVKTGDIVQIISGKHKNHIGKIIKVIPKISKVVIKDLNLKIKHMRATDQEGTGQIVNFEAPIHSSNVMLYSIQHKVRSRHHVTIKNNTKYRKLNKTEEVIE